MIHEKRNIVMIIIPQGGALSQGFRGQRDLPGLPGCQVKMEALDPLALEAKMGALVLPECQVKTGVRDPPEVQAKMEALVLLELQAKTGVPDPREVQV
jgi:hypothetical protein